MIFDILSLERLSLNCIEDNFSRFLYNYKSSKDEDLKRNLTFLQRAYTQQLLYDFVNNDKLEREHLDFLLNKHLQHLNISTLLSLCLNEKEILDKVIPIAENLQELSYVIDIGNSNSVGTSNLKKILLESINVKKITMPKICNDKLLECIASSCPGLVELDIHDSTVTGKGIKNLCSNSDGFIQAKCPIKIINLLNTNIKKNDVAFLLKNLPTLETVRYKRLPSVIANLYWLNRSENNQETITLNLLSLDFIGYRSEELKRVLEVCVETCPNLKTLIGSVETDHLKLICAFSNLVNLTLYYSQSASTGYVCINDFLTLIGKKLKTLRLDFFSLSLSVLVEHCPNLESLELLQVFLNDSRKDCAQSLKLLRSLHIRLERNPEFVDTAPYIKFLYFCPDLENLHLGGDFSETDFEELLKLSLDCNLKRLTFSFSNVRYDFLVELITICKSLRHLSLTCCFHLHPRHNYQIEKYIKIHCLKVKYSCRYHSKSLR